MRVIAAIVAVASMIVVCAPGQSAASGPVLGKWKFAGKDNAGLVWTGTLTSSNLDPKRFDPKRHPWLCSLEMESNDQSKGTKGVEAPCDWEARSRSLSFTTGYKVLHLYSATLSADGSRLTNGKWTESMRDVDGKSGELIRSGTWSAKF